MDSPAILNEQVDAPDRRRATLVANYAYNLPNNWQTVSYYQFETDEQQNLDGRSILGLGAGKRLINIRRHRFDTYAGIALNIEEFDLGEEGVTMGLSWEY